MIWTCFIPGEPAARAEKRVTYRTKDHRVISKLADKPHVASYKSFVREFIATRGPKTLLDGPLALTIWVYRQKPKSASKKRLYPITKPDWTNYAKLVEDCLKSLVIVDDALVVTATVEKRFAVEGHIKPGVYIAVRELDVTEQLRPSHLWRGADAQTCTVTRAREEVG